MGSARDAGWQQAPGAVFLVLGHRRPGLPSAEPALSEYTDGLCSAEVGLGEAQHGPDALWAVFKCLKAVIAE